MSVPNSPHLKSVADKAAAAKSAGAFVSGAVVGTVGGLIRLGGAEFRLPLLISVFRYAPLEAIILNKATSLIVVASALLFRTRTVPLDLLASHWKIVVNPQGPSRWIFWRLIGRSL